jgi:hypothetical protein
VPIAPVTEERPPTVHVVPPSLVVTVWEAVRRFAPPSRVRRRSETSTPVTGSEKTIVIVLTSVLRGSGVTSTTSAVGPAVSTRQVSEASPATTLPAASVMPVKPPTTVNR